MKVAGQASSSVKPKLLLLLFVMIIAAAAKKTRGTAEIKNLLSARRQ
jgi:hypothetical protein